jgi:hypothetical protein
MITLAPEIRHGFFAENAELAEINGVEFSGPQEIQNTAPEFQKKRASVGGEASSSGMARAKA